MAALAQMPTYKLGRAPTPDEIRAWDINVSADGKGLPPGSGTAKEGAPIYAAKCAACHGKTGDNDGPTRGMRALVGKGPLKGGDVDPNKNVGNYYPFATTLWETINRTMPFYKEGSLSASEVYALTALLLYRNEIGRASCRERV